MISDKWQQVVIIAILQNNQIKGENCLEQSLWYNSKGINKNRYLFWKLKNWFKKQKYVAHHFDYHNHKTTTIIIGISKLFWPVKIINIVDN